MSSISLLTSLLVLAAAEPATEAPGAGFQVDRYAVALRPDLATRSLSGTETIVVQSHSDRLAQLSFTANALQISDMRVDDVPAPVSSTKDSIRVSLPRPLRKGDRATLRFRIRGTPARGITALAGGLYTSYFACDWMVCLQDAPGDKAHFDLDLYLPQGIDALGVGRARPPKRLPGGLALHRWRSTRPYSPYLYAFAAGAFLRHSARTPQGELVYLDATGGKAQLPDLFAQTPAIVAFLANKAGMKLPDGRYAQLLVPGGEAQEAAGFSLIGRAEFDRERDDPASAWIVTHELAHMWWGNLVTCATWQDFWLHEGIATFMVAAWQERTLGAAAYQRELDVARGRVARIRALGFDKPLAWGGKYPSLGARRAVQYSKGALFLAHLREFVGDEAFWSGLRRFTRKHAGGTVTSRDFQQAMERASGRDLQPTFREWVYGE
ncbi:M1 family metallopeptidase [Allosphingosinicella deserti]|uniref:Aminopeptidase N n=1 Tax=Allosphingosinicella deserti TaxID=2116704 RepID=A0A2P7QY49_9SPHN|nr:M1 family metallopeptidase [Sphingomonas deserti]PSJ42875.1 aminopeptidase [Sphingomonas deserti]